MDYGSQFPKYLQMGLTKIELQIENSPAARP